MPSPVAPEPSILPREAPAMLLPSSRHSSRSLEPCNRVQFGPSAWELCMRISQSMQPGMHASTKQPPQAKSADLADVPHG